MDKPPVINVHPPMGMEAFLKQEGMTMEGFNNLMIDVMHLIGEQSSKNVRILGLCGHVLVAQAEEMGVIIQPYEN